MRKDSTTSRSQSTPQRGAPGGNQCLLPRVIVWLRGSNLCPLGLPAQKSKPREFEVKATYLYNFARFVEWPTTAAAAKNDSFPICVLGQIHSARSRHHRAGENHRWQSGPGETGLETAGCSELPRFVYKLVPKRPGLREVLAGLDKAAVLTVSDIPQFSQRGGMIQFVQESNKIRFEVNLASARGRWPHFEFRAAKVAVLVRKNSQPGD